MACKWKFRRIELIKAVGSISETPLSSKIRGVYPYIKNHPWIRVNDATKERDFLSVRSITLR